MKLVFIDDEIDSCLSFYAVFRRKYMITTFVQPQEAIDWVINHPVDVVLSDFDMPELDGIQFLNTIATISPNSFRILITGSLEQSSIESALKNQIIHHCIRKPWQRQEIISILETFK